MQYEYKQRYVKLKSSDRVTAVVVFLKRKQGTGFDQGKSTLGYQKDDEAYKISNFKMARVLAPVGLTHAWPLAPIKAK